MKINRELYERASFALARILDPNHKIYSDKYIDLNHMQEFEVERLEQAEKLLNSNIKEKYAEKWKEAQQLQVEVDDLKETMEVTEDAVSDLASQMIYKGNSVEYWVDKAVAYKLAVGDKNSEINYLKATIIGGMGMCETSTSDIYNHLKTGLDDAKGISK